MSALGLFLFQIYTLCYTVDHYQNDSVLKMGSGENLSNVLPIDDLRKSRGLHSVRAFGHGPVYRGVAQSRLAFVGGGGGGGYSEHVGKMTDTRKQKAEKASEMPIKRSLLAGNVQIG